MTNSFRVGARASELIRDEFDLRSLAPVQVKGKTKPVEVFTLIGANNEPGTGSFFSGSRPTKLGFENSASAIYPGEDSVLTGPRILSGRCPGQNVS